jgi:hypothetical protein
MLRSGTEFISKRSSNHRYERKPAAQEDPAVESGGLTILSSYLIRAAEHDLQAHLCTSTWVAANIRSGMAYGLDARGSNG